jgi:hypothetical protein
MLSKKKGSGWKCSAPNYNDASAVFKVRESGGINKAAERVLPKRA